MGRHRDPDSLRFLNWLEKKGKEMGYFTELEGSVGQNMYQIDVVWKNCETGDPIITFEVETINHNSIFKNTNKIFQTPQYLVPKPLHHFMIVLKNSLTKGQKGALHYVLNQHNTSLFENLLDDKEAQQKFLKKLGKFSNLPDEKIPFLSFFRSNLLIATRSLDSDFAQFGTKLPFLLKDDFVPFQEKHVYEKAPNIIEHLKKRLNQIKSVIDLTREDLDDLLVLTKLVERIDGKETCCLSQNICPKCGSKIIESETSYGGFSEDDSGQYTIHRVGCDSCDYTLDEEVVQP